jgi:hypothetical protein
MKLRETLAGLLIFAAIGTAQQPAYRSRGSPHPYPPDGKVTVAVDLREPVTSLDQLIRMSEIIVDGTVTSVLPSIGPNPDPGIPAVETHSLVSLTEALYGAAPAGAKTVVLAQTGGKAGKWNVIVPEDPLVKKGERYILFLDVDDRKDPVNTTGLPRYFAVGLWSGKAKVENGKIQFLPSAVPGLHESDNTNVSDFIATVRDKINILLATKRP